MSIAELFHAKRTERSQRATPHLRGSRRRRRGKLPPRQRKFLLEPLEPRLLLSTSPLSYAVAAGTAADLTLRLQPDPNTPLVQLINSADPNPATQIVASQALADTSSVIVTGAQLDDRLTIDGSVPSTLPVQFDGGGGSDTLIGPYVNTDWIVNGKDAGTLSRASGLTVTFIGVENLHGGTDFDNFKLDSDGSISGQIDGGAGVDTLTGPDADNNWTINGANTGSATGINLFDNVENLTGRSGADQFTLLDGASISGQIDGGDGVDTLIGPNTANIWSVSGLDAGALNVGAVSGFANFRSPDIGR